MFKQLRNIFFNHRKTASFFLGSLSVQTLPPFYKWYLLFICWSGLLCLVQKAETKKQAFATGYWFGFGFFAFGLLWISNALLINPMQTGWLIPITFLASGAFFGLFIAVPSLLSWLNKTPDAQYLSLSAWIVVFEWIRSWLLTGFPWNLWGSTLAFSTTLLQSASLFGTYGLSLAVLLTASAPALWLENKNKHSAIKSLTIIILIPILLFGYGTWRIKNLSGTPNNGIKVRLVQPSIPQSAKWSPDLKQKHFQTYLDLSASKPLDDIDIVIWGETASPYALDIDSDAMAEIPAATSPNGYLISGLIRYQDNYYGGWLPFNSSLIINHNGLVEDFYDKTHLVPFGEYIPLREWLPDFVRPVTNIISNLQAGTGPKIINIPNIPPFGIQICYEIIFPHHIIKSDEKPRWIINLTNDGWYGLSAGPYQHLTTARLRAIEEGLTIVRSANSGISAVINRYGKITASLPLAQTGILDVTLPQNLDTPTLYNKLGNIPSLFLCLLLISCALYLHRKSKTI